MTPCFSRKPSNRPLLTESMPRRAQPLSPCSGHGAHQRCPSTDLFHPNPTRSSGCSSSHLPGHSVGPLQSWESGPHSVASGWAWEMAVGCTGSAGAGHSCAHLQGSGEGRGWQRASSRAASGKGEPEGGAMLGGRDTQMGSEEGQASPLTGIAQTWELPTVRSHDEMRGQPRWRLITVTHKVGRLVPSDALLSLLIRRERLQEACVCRSSPASHRGNGPQARPLQSTAALGWGNMRAGLPLGLFLNYF